MKLTHIAQALTLALLLATAWLAYQASEESHRANEKMDRLTAGQTALSQQQQQTAATQSEGTMMPAVPSAASVSPSSVPPAVASVPAPLPVGSGSTSAGSSPAEPTAAALARAGNPQPPAPAAAVPAPMTPLQKRILEAPSLGKIADVVPQHGFVTFKVPDGAGLKQGMKFDLRRNSAVVGRITVEAIEPDAVVANLDPKSVPAGVSVQVGDEVISIIMAN